MYFRWLVNGETSELFLFSGLPVVQDGGGAKTGTNDYLLQVLVE